MSSEAAWYVVCAEWWTGPHKSREAAERRLEQIESSGQCLAEHRLEAGYAHPEPSS